MRWIALIAVLAALGSAAMAGLSQSQGSRGGRAGRTPAGVLEVRVPGAGVVARIALKPYLAGERLRTTPLRREIRRRLPRTKTIRRQRSRIRYRLDVGEAARRALSLGVAGGRVSVPTKALAARVQAPIVRQRLRNNCETAALQILLATVGRRVDQLALQRRIRRSGPLDPIGSGATRTWGDPELGFVGRPAGGGVAGGFGVYPRPVVALAARYGRTLDDLTGRSPSAVFRRLRQGHAVMAWIGLSDGPYGTWRSPTGRRVIVSFGEHAVVLVGIQEGGDVEVVNPLRGTFEVWTPGQFRMLWSRLGRRALTTT